MPAVLSTPMAQRSGLEKWLTREGLAEIRDGKVIPTERTRAVVDMQRPEYHGDARRRATRLG